jgi:small subunit ribosomal protein S1
MSENMNDQQRENPETVVDTGRRVDVSKVMLKKNMVRTIEKKDESEVTGEPKAPVVIMAVPQSHEPRPEQRRPRPKPKAKTKEREIEVVRRPMLENLPHHEEMSPAPHVVRPEAKVWDDSGDFASMLGDRVRSRLIHVAGETAFFSLGSRYEGSMPLNELRRDSGEFICQVGDEIDVYVVGLTNGILLSTKVGKHMADMGMLEEAKNSGIPVEGTITGVNAGGYDISIANTRAFCPLGQMDIEFIEDPKLFIGRSLSFMVAKITEGGRNIVLNRRKLLEAEKKRKQDERLKTLAVGDRVQGKVARLADFGAFIDLDGVDGLIPNSELGFSRVLSASDRVKVGDIVTAEVLRIEPDKKREGHMRIALSLKAAMPDPFETHRDEIIPGQTLEGKVARLETFGAFIELFDGVDGLIHISELSEQRVKHPSEVLTIGSPVTVRILDVDFEKRRVSLSLRENVQKDKEAQKDRPRVQPMSRGALTEGVVERIERYGVFLKLANGQTALLPSSETGTPRGADLGKYYELGTTLPVMVIEVDDRGRVRVSTVAREKADERADYESFSKKLNSASKGFGTLGDLLNKKLK